MTNHCVFSIVDRNLLIVDASSGHQRWRGMPFGVPVSDARTLPGRTRAVVLLDYMARPTGRFENLVCVDCDGQVMWRALLPTDDSNEAYVSFDLDDDQLRANAWSGNRVEIDALTGDLLRSWFTK